MKSAGAKLNCGFCGPETVHGKNCYIFSAMALADNLLVE
jgi:hypothetical protein